MVSKPFSLRQRPDKQEDGYPSIDWCKLHFLIDYDEGKLLYKETYGTRGRRHKRSLTEIGWNQSKELGYKMRMYAFTYSNGEVYKTGVHRIIWAMHYGEWPKKEIDHIDGNPFNNRIENLREVDHLTNGRNQRTPINNTSGACGIWQDKRYSKLGKWGARIKVDYKTKHIGMFDTFEEAVAARKEAEIKHGFHENHGTERVNAEGE
jgi:hypothetical protein